MTDPRPGAWLSGLVLGVVSGVTVVMLGSIGLVFALASLALITWKGPRGLAFAGLLTGFGLIWTVLFAHSALTCGGPFDPRVSTCVASDLTRWISGSAAIFAFGLVTSARALQRTRR